MRNGLSDHNGRRSLRLAGHVRPAALASQTKTAPSPWIPWAYPQEGCQRDFFPERLVLEARVSGQDDDVRRFLRDGGFTIQIELRNSLYFPRTLVRNGMG